MEVEDMAGTPHTRHARLAKAHAAWVTRLVADACNTGKRTFSGNTATDK
jgi:hypothetical protein